MSRWMRRLARASLVLGHTSVWMPQTALAQSDELLARLDSLEQEVRVLRRQLEVKNEADATRAKETPVVGGGKDGFFIQAPDRKFQLRLRGYAQADSRLFARPDHVTSDTFGLRRVRLNFEGTVGEKIDFRIMPDFAGGTFTLFDAYVNLKYRPAAMLQVGKFKPPVGLERLQSATATSFIERGFPTLFVPSRDIGVQLWGELFEGKLAYQTGFFNGVRDGGNVENQDRDTDDGKDFAARIFTHPFADSALDSLRGLGLGVSFTTGRTEQAVPSYGNPGIGQVSFLTYRAAAGTTPAVAADGRRVRVSPQAYWYWGPFGALGEYVRAQQTLERGSDGMRATHDAWQLSLSYVLTGENASFRGVTPRSELGGDDGFGALELAARVQGITFDDDVFPVFSNPDTSVERALGFTAGINWYLNRYIRLSLNYDHVDYDGGRAGGRDREADDQILTRVQLNY
jgi:phosphate-selective porin OprO and OprP